MNLFITQAFTDTKMFLMVTLVVVFSICLHEFFHAWTALRFGDTTAADRGHLTLNPLRQMGPMSIIMFLILGFAWGAVPVNPAVLRAKSRHAPAIVSLAGPATNFGLFLIGFFFFGFLQTRIPSLVENEAAGMMVLQLFLLLGVYNCFLCIFNLLPIPGLDGWGALTEYVPRMKNLKSEFAKGVTIFLIFLLLFLADDIFELAVKVMMLAPDIFRAG
ncbi:MAG: site-2 protease family protein [Lentisphaeria bacterium]|nr:site-2 protease family protein [Lentisphaeria bacterium]